MLKKEKIEKYFNQHKKLTLKDKKYKNQVKWLIDFMLKEDLGDKGDITTDLLIKHNSPTTAVIVAKENGVIAGLEEIKWLLTKYKIHGIKYKKDGDIVNKGDTILKITGNIKTILKLERTILNILQRMSGIATQTNKLVKLTHNKALVCPTRKTQWGLLDKKAVTLGGGGTHRLGLYDWVLIKDNHLKQFSNHQSLITNHFYEIEIDDEQQLKHFLQFNPPAIMLDNFTSTDIKRILHKYYTNTSETIIEASGGINEKNIKEYAKTGVDIISIGALTHSVRALDISLDIS